MTGGIATVETSMTDATTSSGIATDGTMTSGAMTGAARATVS